MVMRRLLLAMALLAGLNACADTGDHGSRPELVWADEFDGSGPVDAKSWNVVTGNKEFDGWGNEELQYYTADSLARDGKGNLAITAAKAGPAADLPCWTGKNCEYT